MSLTSAVKKITGGIEHPQACLILTEDNHAVDTVQEVEKGYIVNDDTGEAWGLDTTHQVKNEKGAYMQVIAERDFCPLPIYQTTNEKKKPVKKGEKEESWETNLLTTVADNTWGEAVLNADTRERDDKRWWLIFAIVALLGLCILLIIFRQFYLTGKVVLPWK